MEVIRFFEQYDRHYRELHERIFVVSCLGIIWADIRRIS